MSATAQSIFSPPLPQHVSEGIRWGKLYGSALGLALERVVTEYEGLVVVITEDTASAQHLNDQLQFYIRGNDLPQLIFPDWETLPYDAFSPHQDIISQRLETLYQLPAINKGILVVPVQTLMHRLPPRQYVQQRSLFLKQGQALRFDEFRLQLVESGYEPVSTVMEHGEFAVRGSLIDLFPMGNQLPFRIELFDDEIESIRTFDPETQRTIGKVEQLRMLPAREFPLDETGIKQFRQTYRAQFEGDPARSVIYREISGGHAPAGIEYYIPLFFENTETLFDYLPKQSLLLHQSQLGQQVAAFEREAAARYESMRHDIERPTLPPSQLYLDSKDIESRITQYPRIQWQTYEHEDSSAVNFATQAPPQLLITARSDAPTAELNNFLNQYPGRVLFVAESAGRRETLLALLRNHHISPVAFTHWHEFLDAADKMGICVAPLEHGLALTKPDIQVITETQLFGQQVLQRRRRSRQQRDTENVFKSLAELSIGSPVVHEEYGVGRYLGLQTLNTSGIEAEFLTLEYADQDKLYVPVSSLHLISRYTGVSPETAPLHKLGSGQWERARRKAQQRVRDVAAELLDIYAKREAKQGTTYSVDEAQYQSFAGEFPFEETPDQQTAIENIIKDMASTRPMDHLVCGDVGFGKTEVAMRAAFIAVMNGKQVAILTPTTLLTQQHLQTFSDRFADWPIRIAGLSRFRSKKEQSSIIQDLAAGKVDIIIGTHKLLQKDVKYKSLGLVIIDEEHRFGVRQKETFKSLRAEVDILTLTATPIPRTLNMSMSGMRDLSIIATPPAKRLAIKTFIAQWNDRLVIEAVTRELKRGGQVFFVHNDVDTIQTQLKKLKSLLPEARIDFAHGQMRERELEQVMSDFYHQRFNILVCTTIIETGIDIPNANTIIINRADRFGLAQLYQLRGRVGRSHHRAYAYLVVPADNAISADAKKRLEAIESIETLGTGFTLATHDLEIRGAGELLGDEQSGQMHEIGYAMYTELLERAVKFLKAGKKGDIDFNKNTTEVVLHIPALIPEDYLPDVHERLVLYKRIASAKNDTELNELKVEMIDRFGLLPDATRHLFDISLLRTIAEPLGVQKIDMSERGGYILFNDAPSVDTGTIIDLIQTQSQIYKLDGNTKLKINFQEDDPGNRIEFLHQLLARLQLKQAA